MQSPLADCVGLGGQGDMDHLARRVASVGGGLLRTVLICAALLVRSIYRRIGGEPRMRRMTERLLHHFCGLRSTDLIFTAASLNLRCPRRSVRTATCRSQLATSSCAWERPGCLFDLSATRRP